MSPVLKMSPPVPTEAGEVRITEVPGSLDDQNPTLDKTGSSLTLVMSFDLSTLLKKTNRKMCFF